MAALPPSADVFHLERRRLEEAAADLRSLLAEKNEQLSEQCAKCAHEEEKLLRSKYLAEFEEISLQKDALKAKLEKNTSDLEHQEMDLNRAEERKKAVEEYQSHLRLTEGTKNDLVARISQLKAKQRGATESLKSQMCHVLEAHQKEEAKLSQKLRGQEEALARNEACATADVLQGMTPQESLAADLKHQLSASQEKVATLEASVESMQALSFQKEMRVEEMIEACDTALKQKALQRDIAEKEATELQKGEQSVKAATLEIERLQEANALAKDLQEKLHTSGLVVTDMRAAVCQDKAPEEEWISEKMRLQVEIRKLDEVCFGMYLSDLAEFLALQLQFMTTAGEISNALSDCEMQAKEQSLQVETSRGPYQLAFKLSDNPLVRNCACGFRSRELNHLARPDLGQLQSVFDAKGRRLRMLSSLVQ
ncbi:unnamed protein product, partial [Cladocopium goreaui]